MLKLCDQLEITGRNGSAPKLHHCVLVHPRATIRRPDKKVRDTSIVMKADQFRSWHEEFKERGVGMGDLVGSLLNIRSSETLREFAEKLVRHHRPADQLALPPFMRPRQGNTATAPLAAPVAPRAPANAASETPTGQVDPGLRMKLVCASCGTKITYPEGKFCWKNEKRFGGFQYCREHQAGF